VNAYLKIDFRMKVGAQATTVTVSAPPTVLDTQSSSVGTTIEQGKVQELPLNGRHFLELTLFTPGVVPAAGGSENSTRGGGINVNGLRESMNNYLLDGMSNTSMGVGQYVVTPQEPDHSIRVRLAVPDDQQDLSRFDQRHLRL